MKTTCAYGRKNHSWTPVAPEGIYKQGVFRRTRKRDKNGEPETEQMFKCKIRKNM